jgi:hypothetical protein
MMQALRERVNPQAGAAGAKSPPYRFRFPDTVT